MVSHEEALSERVLTGRPYMKNLISVVSEPVGPRGITNCRLRTTPAPVTFLRYSENDQSGGRNLILPVPPPVQNW